jgi:glycosyltransferase involved in cell wall biosynthesis
MTIPDRRIVELQKVTIYDSSVRNNIPKYVHAMTTNTKTISVAIILPAYNESTTIGSVVQGLRRALLQAKVTNIIVVVDDNSTDNTAELAENAGAYVIRHVYNIGSGGATATGLSYAKSKGYKMAATFDADGQHDPRDIIKGIKLALNNDSDLLIGSRLINNIGMPKLKIFGNKGLSLITFFISGVKVTDSQSGLRIFSHKALNALIWKTYGYGYCSEMIWRAKQHGLKVKEYPIRAIYTPYSKAKGQNNWNAIHIISTLIKWRILEFIGE